MIKPSSRKLLRTAVAMVIVGAGGVIAAVPGHTAAAHTLHWRPCPGDKSGMQCADLQVPVDWQKPDGRKITLKLGRLPATGRSEGSVLVAYGGPGGPGILFTRQLQEQWAGLRKRMDIVTWDTRGYGAQFGGTSTGLPCNWTRIPFPEFPPDEAEFGRLTDTNRGYAEGCRAQDPELFANMSSADHARDMEAIRNALGERRLNFYGASYAGFYAQAYARLFPDRVRTMVLDGTWSHSAADWNQELDESARRSETAMRRFFTWCATDKSCALHGQDVAPLWQALVARADRSPIPAKRAGIHYDGRDLQGLGFLLVLLGPENWATLARAIRNADLGDASDFVPQRGPRYPDSGTPVTECLDWPRFGNRTEMRATVDRLNRIAPNTGTAGTVATATLGCVGWPVPVTNPPSPLPQGLPPLLGAGAWDESDAVQAVLDQVPDSALIRHDGPGHTLYPFNTCAREHIDRYFTDQVLPPGAETRC